MEADLKRLELIDEERVRRRDIWNEVISRGGPKGLKAKEDIRNLRILTGDQGIARDLARHTGKIDPIHGVTVGVSHRGTHYADDLHDWGIFYHYPVTGRGKKDELEIEATKNASRFNLPIFVVVDDGKLRDVYLGRISEWDDNQQVFQIDFDPEWLEEPVSADFIDVPSEGATSRKKRKTSMKESVERDSRFGFKVKKHYGTKCAMCEMTEAKLIQGAHLISVEKDGSDHVGNGLPLCANHHLAMDTGLVAVHPESFQIVVTKGKEGLGVTREGIKGHLNNLPDPECLRHVWNEHDWDEKI